MQGLLYFSSSSSSTGSVSITLNFVNGTDLDIAAVQTQNRVARAEPRLPEEVRRNGIQVSKSGSGFLMLVALRSTDGSMSSGEINNLMASRVVDPIQRVDGVGSVRQFGSAYGMRIWLNPDKLHGYGLSATDALAAVRAQNVQFAAGSIGGAPATDEQGFTATVSGESRFSTPQQFADIILRANPDGTHVRLGDVARIELGPATLWALQPLQRQARRRHGRGTAARRQCTGSGRGRASADEAACVNFPPGVSWLTPFDSSTFVSISIREVVKTLFEAVVLVFLVMLLFLQNLRATLIPTLVVPVALTGAFAGLFIAGFSINVLTLFGLVLAIGIVVDDAIVVVENVERLMSEEGLSPQRSHQKGHDADHRRHRRGDLGTGIGVHSLGTDEWQCWRHLSPVRPDHRHFHGAFGPDGADLHAGTVRQPDQATAEDARTAFCAGSMPV